MPTVTPKPQHDSPSKLKPGATLRVEDIAYEVQHVLHRPLPGQAAPAETLLLARCLSGRNASRQALIQCLEGPEDSPVLRHAHDGGKLAQRMDHPHVARVWQVHADSKALYIVSEYLAGFDLETVASFSAMLKRPPLTSFVCFIGAAVADALDYVHRLEDDAGKPLGVIHRGVNLANIRLGTGGEVKLSGFDVMFSKLVGRRQTTTNALRGDLAYAAPEYVCHGQQDRRLDFFALGMVMLELLMGSHPLDDPYEVVPQPPTGVSHEERLQAEQRPWLPLDVLAQRLMSFSPEQVELAALEQPDAVVAILKRALEREPEKRYQTGAEMRDDLYAYLNSLPVPYSPEAAVEEVRHLRDQSQATVRRADPLESLT
ncbi:serine/threonine protein kinase [Archangium sp.]|uniref:serine/threonine protein kinase n=1 Tax=Archangium sp. TaxID=1872627 RepID=UPI002D25417E|nr:protein kinase [Archangium sp.]HYO53450.1 protein kinase [Archangium sp.]